MNVFITGTDTGAGKTHFTAAVLRACGRRDVAAIGMKPIASGAEETSAGWHNEDVAALRAAAPVAAPDADINPYLFALPASPHIAAAAAGVDIDIDVIEAAYRRSFPVSGIPADSVSMRFVNGFTYSRLVPLIGPDKPPRKPPPTWVLKIVTRLHPEFRRRTKAAAAALHTPPAREVIADWHARIRPRLAEQNLAHTDVDLPSLSDGELAAHLDALLAHGRENLELHFWLHTYDLAGIARLIHAGREWGLTGAEIVPALAGASPSTSQPVKKLAAIREAVARAEVVPTSLDDVRQASATAASLLDDYLRHHGSVLYAGYDLDVPTLREVPEVILATIVNDPAGRLVDDSAVQTRA